MTQKRELPSTEILDGTDLQPRHESWARATTRSNLVSLEVFVALAALFVIVIAMHPSRGVLLDLAIIAGFAVAAVIAWLVWSSAPLRRRQRFLGNAGMTVRIKADLVTELGANDVNVDSAEGVVTLRGTVPYDDFRIGAEELARRQGAHQVINKLTVTLPAPGWPETYVEGLPGVTAPAGAPEVPTRTPLDERVREALEDDPRVNAYVAIVHVEDGIAYLTGRQETVQASEAATEDALHVPGILGVTNDIEIMSSV